MWYNLIAGNGMAALADCRAYIEIEGETSYTVLNCYLGARQADRTAEAAQLLEDGAAKCDPKEWPYPVIRYFRREITGQQLFDLAIDQSKLTDVYTFNGMDLSLSGKKDEALTQLSWVVKNGTDSKYTYFLARTEYVRLGGVLTNR